MTYVVSNPNDREVHDGNCIFFKRNHTAQYGPVVGSKVAVKGGGCQIVCRSLLYTTVRGDDVLMITGDEVYPYCLLGPPCGKMVVIGKMWKRNKEE